MGTVKAISLPKASAGILLFRQKGEGMEVLLGHPGGPFWKKKDQGVDRSQRSYRLRGAAARSGQT